MRMYGYLKEPIPANRQEMIYKVMVHQIRKEGVFVYLYTNRDALFASYDCHYSDLEDAREDWDRDVEEWIPLDDPLPACQHDCFLPVRVKGRTEGRPQWGHYEILEDGKWRDFVP